MEWNPLYVDDCFIIKELSLGWGSLCLLLKCGSLSALLSIVLRLHSYPWICAHRLPAQVYGQSPYYDSGFQRVWLKQNLNFKGWSSHVHRGFPGSFESSYLSKDNLSREIGRTVPALTSPQVSLCYPFLKHKKKHKTPKSDNFGICFSLETRLDCCPRFCPCIRTSPV